VEFRERLTTAGLPDPTFGSKGVSPIEGATNFTQILINDGDQLAVGVGQMISRALT
jgi:hypothetical protein